jgi:hypothetical protein
MPLLGTFAAAAWKPLPSTWHGFVVKKKTWHGLGLLRRRVGDAVLVGLFDLPVPMREACH